MAEYIEREDLIRRLELSIKSYGRDCNSNAPVITRTYQEVLDKVKHLHAADVVEVRHGKWKKVSEKYPRYVCTSCNHLYNNKEYKYCPNCGANMNGKEQGK